MTSEQTAATPRVQALCFIVRVNKASHHYPIFMITGYTFTLQQHIAFSQTYGDVSPYVESVCVCLGASSAHRLAPSLWSCGRVDSAAVTYEKDTSQTFFFRNKPIAMSC